MTAGVTTGVTTGVTVGVTAGETAGGTAGETAGVMAGVKAGETAGCHIILVVPYSLFLDVTFIPCSRPPVYKNMDAQYQLSFDAVESNCVWMGACSGLCWIMIEIMMS